MKRVLIVGWAVFYLLGVMHCGSSKPTQPIKTTQVAPKSTTPTSVAPKPIAQDTTKVQHVSQTLPEKTPAPSPEPAPMPQATEVLPATVTTATTLTTLPVDTPLTVAALDTARIDTATTQSVVEDTVALETSAEPLLTEPATILAESLLFDDIFFDEGQSAAPSSTLNPYYYATLGKIIKVWKTCPDCYLRVKGHIGLSKVESQTPELAFKRALTVGKLILELFPMVEQENIAARIEPVGAGLSEILVATADKRQDAFNRRVSIELIKGGIPSKSLAEYRQMLTKPVPSAAGKKAAPPEAGLPRPVSSMQALYDNALKLFDQKRYAAAIASLQEVVELNPRHTLADNAQWWIGEAYYAQGDYHNALEAFQQVFDLGDGNKAAYAQLRLGYCYLHLGQKEAALTALQKVIDRYPQASEEVVKARKMLRSLAEK